jgi:hypothetical protein
MQNIPIEFLPDLWVSDSSGISGNGSAFCQIEQIKCIFLLDKQSPIIDKSVSVLHLSSKELMQQNYIDAFSKIIIDTWLVSKPVMILGNPLHTNLILISILTQYMNVSPPIAMNIIKTKIDM